MSVSQKDSSTTRVTLSTTSGRACVANCIDKDLFFCASEDFREGLCCDSASEKCRFDPGGLCSFDQRQGGVEGYLACPFERDICGQDREIELSADGTIS